GGNPGGRWLAPPRCPCCVGVAGTRRHREAAADGRTGADRAEPLVPHGRAVRRVRGGAERRGRGPLEDLERTRLALARLHLGNPFVEFPAPSPHLPQHVIKEVGRFPPRVVVVGRLRKLGGFFDQLGLPGDRVRQQRARVAPFLL